MRDYAKPVRTGYFKRLNGAVFYASQVINVYPKQAPNDAIYPYIILSSQTGVDDSTKNQQGQEVTMLVDVVTGFLGAVNDDQANEICDQIYQLVHPQNDGFIDVGPYLTIISTILELDNDLDGQNGAFKLHRRLLRFRHIIHEQISN